MAPTDSWQNEYRGVEQYGQDIMEKINERNRLRRSGSNYARIESDIRFMLKNFSRDLEGLKQSLLRASSSYHITEREVDRRQNMIDQLITKERQLSSAFQQEPTSKDLGRDTLLSRGTNDANPFDSPYMLETDDMSVTDMRSQQHQIIEEQDKGLDALSGIIQRQKMIGHAISDEVDTQNEIIVDVADRMDSTHSRIMKETTHVKKVTAKSSTCGMLIVIVLLLIVIVVVAVVPS
ncbi:syntaxin-8-like isoform X2 [Actinia tenebrosa]|uniref:Syntaxin-8-like isoform X2 n=1 Tax=Actinia tenebrosa TaxID=6105 RepID=A0A6P8J213_ACTTE|nr:syntaxin-8-like isoform X2 [Actinia tenebrosa]